MSGVRGVGVEGGTPQVRRQIVPWKEAAIATAAVAFATIGFLGQLHGLTLAPVGTCPAHALFYAAGGLTALAGIAYIIVSEMRKKRTAVAPKGELQQEKTGQKLAEEMRWGLHLGRSQTKPTSAGLSVGVGVTKHKTLKATYFAVGASHAALEKLANTIDPSNSETIQSQLDTFARDQKLPSVAVKVGNTVYVAGTEYLSIKVGAATFVILGSEGLVGNFQSLQFNRIINEHYPPLDTAALIKNQMKEARLQKLGVIVIKI